MTGGCGSRVLNLIAALNLFIAIQTRPNPALPVNYDIPHSGLSFALNNLWRVANAFMRIAAFSPAVNFSCVGAIRYEVQIPELDMRLTSMFVVRQSLFVLLTPFLTVPSRACACSRCATTERRLMSTGPA
jgi:hypothetical protein